MDARYTIALARPRDVPALASIERAAGRIFESRVAASLFEQTVDEDDFRAARSGHREITLTTFRDIPWNLPFYARLGFEEIPAGDLDLELAALVREEASRGLDPALRAVIRLRVP